MEVSAALQQGHRVLKIKVGRRADPALDALAVLRARELAGPDVALRGVRGGADAGGLEGGWCSGLGRGWAGGCGRPATAPEGWPTV